MAKKNPKNIRESAITRQRMQRYRKLKESAIDDIELRMDELVEDNFAIGCEILRRWWNENGEDLVQHYWDCRGGCWWIYWPSHAAAILKEHGIKVGTHRIVHEERFTEFAWVPAQIDSVETRFINFHRFILSLYDKRTPLLPLEQFKGSSDDGADPIQVCEVTEAKLIDFFLALNGSSNGTGEIENSLRVNANDSKKLAVIKKFADDHKCPALAESILVFSIFWMRDPLGFEESDQADLVDYLFVKHKPPMFLYGVWRNEFCRSHLKYFIWFIAFAQGVSLTRVAYAAGWRCGRSFFHHLQTTPAYFSFELACVRAETLSWGGTDRDVERVCRHPAYCVDPTEFGSDTPDGTFWIATIRWMIRNSAHLNDAEADLVLDWARHMYTEGAKPERVQFSWKGRTVRSVLRASHEYRHSPNCNFSALNWPNHGWDWTLQTNYQRWEFKELVTGFELYDEGEAMKHCVSGYARSCFDGVCAIFSVRCNGIRSMTVEINLAKRYISQAVGPRNASVSDAEESILSQWMSTKVTKETRNLDPPEYDDPEYDWNAYLFLVHVV